MVPGVAPDELLHLRAELALAREQAEQARDKALVAEAEVAKVWAINADLLARNAHLELMNEQMRRDKYGARSERSRHLLDQLELTFEELEANASEAELLGQIAAAKTTTVKAFTRKQSTRRDFPADLPREQVIIPAPEACPCCGSHELSHLPAAITETLERVPARHKVIQTVREKVSCRRCEKISQPPAPFHVTPRGMFGPHFLANLAFQKYGLHQPLNSQRDRLEAEGVPLNLSTLADQIGAICAAVRPLFLLLEAHGLAADRHMLTTPPSRFWLSSRPAWREYGTMCAMIDRSGARRHRWRYVTTPVTVEVSIREHTWQAIPGFSRSTGMPASTPCSRTAARTNP